MTDPDPDRIPVPDVAEPPAVALARRLHEAARADLIREQRHGAPDRVVEALVYRVDRAHERLVAAWRDALRSVGA